MVVIKSARNWEICPFSKKKVKPTNRLGLFHPRQYKAFEKFIRNLFINKFPIDIIDLIIKKTGYKKLLWRFGHEKIVCWTKNNKTFINLYNNNSDRDSDSDSDSIEISSSDEEIHY